jgi:catalase
MADAASNHRGADRRHDPKDEQLEHARVRPDGTPQTTDQGVRVDDTDNSLRAGERGPTLLQDFHFREKITRFDHERIPERVVHARGAGAYGYFELTDSLAEFTCAEFLGEPGLRTPVFVRFSTVQGPRGSADTVRDVRGFATKFYTRAGNYDLVGNNMPVFFIQDAVKFPDFVHAVKPEPHNEIPTGASAHDTFWDFCSLQPESTHMLMWVMSDRAIPRSYRTMQGFGVHTFRLVTADGRGTFVKFHWRPKAGVASQVWDEAQITAGRDPDFHRRDLWDAIEAGLYPEWEFGVQLVPEQDESAFDFDLLDPTKIIPEELVPVRTVGRMVLDRNPDNFFAETEQIAFHTANVVPGIDFSNDPLLQGRNFSYLDTQLIRLGGPNFAQLPVNRPLAPVRHNQRDGYGQHAVYPGPSYAPNSLGGTEVAEPDTSGVYRHYQQRVDGAAVRLRSPSFADHYSQAALFWNSMAGWEKQHIVAAFAFELGHVGSGRVRERMVGNLGQVDAQLAAQVAERLGLPAPKADKSAKPGQKTKTSQKTPDRGRTSPALSLANLLTGEVRGRKVALLGADGVDALQAAEVREQLRAREVQTQLLAPHAGSLGRDGRAEAAVDAPISIDSSVLYDAVIVLGGAQSAEQLDGDAEAARFLTEAYRHGKPIGLLAETRLLSEDDDDEGVVRHAGAGESVSAFTQRFLDALARHRFPQREPQ